MKEILPAVKDFAEDYWDVGAMVLAGLAYNDDKNKIFGDLRFPIMLASGLAGLYRGRESNRRLFRNLSAGLAGVNGFHNKRSDSPSAGSLSDYAITGLACAAALYFDHLRIKEEREEESRLALLE